MTEHISSFHPLRFLPGALMEEESEAGVILEEM